MCSYHPPTLTSNNYQFSPPYPRTVHSNDHFECSDQLLFKRTPYSADIQPVCGDKAIGFQKI